MNKIKLTRPSKASKINKIELNKKIKRKMSYENQNENQLRRSDRLRQKRNFTSKWKRSDKRCGFRVFRINSK